MKLVCLNSICSDALVFLGFDEKMAFLLHFEPSNEVPFISSRGSRRVNAAGLRRQPRCLQRNHVSPLDQRSAARVGGVAKPDGGERRSVRLAPRRRNSFPVSG